MAKQLHVRLSESGQAKLAEVDTVVNLDEAEEYAKTHPRLIG